MLYEVITQLEGHLRVEEAGALEVSVPGVLAIDEPVDAIEKGLSIHPAAGRKVRRGDDVADVRLAVLRVGVGELPLRDPPSLASYNFV